MATVTLAVALAALALWLRSAPRPVGGVKPPPRSVRKDLMIPDGMGFRPASAADCVVTMVWRCHLYLLYGDGQAVLARAA